MFRYVVIAVSIFGVAPNVQAGKAEDICRIYSDLGKSVMTARQEGKQMADVMDATASSSDPSFTDISKKMVIAAYEEPRFGSVEMQQSAVADFQNTVYLQCIKAGS